MSIEVKENSMQVIFFWFDLPEATVSDLVGTA